MIIYDAFVKIFSEKPYPNAKKLVYTLFTEDIITY